MSVSVVVFSDFLEFYYLQRLECIVSLIKNRFMHAILITETLNTFIKGRLSSYVECSTFLDEFYIIAQTFGYCFPDFFKMPVNINFETNSRVVIFLLKDLWRIIPKLLILEIERMLKNNVNATSEKIKYSEGNVKIAKIETIVLIFQNIFC